MDSSKSIKHKTDTIGVPISSKKSKAEARRVHLFDLNNDCLRSVFNFLDGRNLVNVAMINGKVGPENRGRFAAIAAEVFAEKGLVDDKFIRASTFHRYSVNLLQCFGYLIKKMEIYHHTSDSMQSKLLADAVINCCSESLSHIKFDCTETEPFFVNEKCFPNVQQVEFIAGNRFHGFQFNHFFPNAHTLIVDNAYCESGQGEWIAEHFPALKNICFTSFRWSKSNSFYNQLRICLSLNPQLEHLKVLTCRRSYVVSGACLLAFINEKLPNLKTLAVSLNHNHPFVRAYKLNFKNLEELSIIANPRIVFPKVQLNNIKKISVDVHEINNTCIEFLSKLGNASIVSVIGDWKDGDTFNEFIQLIVKMPELKELSIEHSNAVDPSEICAILKACKVLDQFSTHIRYVGDYDIGDVETMIRGLFHEIANDWTWCIRKWKLYHLELEFKANRS